MSSISFRSSGDAYDSSPLARTCRQAAVTHSTTNVPAARIHATLASGTRLNTQQ